MSTLKSLALILMLSMPLQAQVNRWPYYDPDLIEKLFKNDHQNVGNDNRSRQDLIAVIAAFGLPDDPTKKCEFAEGPKLLRYITFLQSDYRTGQAPSNEAKELALISVLYPDPPYVYINDPNLARMAREIEANGCKSDRIQTIRKNFVQLLDDRIAGKNVPGAAAAPSGPARQPAVAPTRPPVPAAPQPVAPAMPIPYTTRITVTSIDAIDLTSADETRTYRAKVESAIFNGKTVPELAVGTEVLLKVSRQIQPNQPKGYEIAVVKIQAVSTTVSGKPVTLTTSPFTATGPIGESMKALMPTQLPAGSKMFFDVQSVK